MMDEKAPLRSNPLFSIVIATYNYGHLIERAVESVFNQKFHDFELIVVDDGSTDDTELRLNRFGNRLRYIRKDNGGQSSAYNLGAKEAKGEYIYILDADDELMPSSLEVFARAIDKARVDEKNSIFYGGHISVSEKGVERERQATNAPKDTERALKNFVTRKISGLQNGSFVVPRIAFARIQYPEQLRNNTDIVFIGQALTIFRAINVRATVLKSHEHPDRTRKQLDRILATGLRPVDVLFDPAIVPEKLMRVRNLYLAYRWRSIARLLYLDGRYKDSRDAYFSALTSYAPSVMDWSSIRRFVSASLKSLRSERTH